MTEVIGIDHIYITVSDLQRSEAFYDRVMLEALGFRKNKFILGGEPHVQYFNRHFGYVLRPSRNSNGPSVNLENCLTHNYSFSRLAASTRAAP